MAQVCPHCKSTRYIKYGHGIRKQAETQKYLCKSCFKCFNHFGYSGKPKFNDMNGSTKGKEESCS